MASLNMTVDVEFTSRFWDWEERRVLRIGQWRIVLERRSRRTGVFHGDDAKPTPPENLDCRTGQREP